MVRQWHGGKSWWKMWSPSGYSALITSRLLCFYQPSTSFSFRLASLCLRVGLFSACEIPSHLSILAACVNWCLPKTLMAALPDCNFCYVTLNLVLLGNLCWKDAIVGSIRWVQWAWQMIQINDLAEVTRTVPGNVFETLHYSRWTVFVEHNMNEFGHLWIHSCLSGCIWLNELKGVL